MKKLLILISMAILSVGCSSSKYYLVESTFVKDESGGEKKPEVTKTRSFKSTFDNISTIAVKAPDACLTGGAGKGESTAISTIMQEKCGVEMAMIETALAKRQYNVISWKVLQNEIEVGKQNNQSVTHMQAAKKLGADALLMMNSLEKSRSSGSSDARWDRRYFQSDRTGRNAGAALVTEEVKKQLNHFASEAKTSSDNQELSVTVNASVVYNTGQAIWFYEWNHVNLDKENDANINSVYVNCQKIARDRHSCSRYQPEQAAKKQTKLSSGESFAVSDTSNPQDQQRAIYHKLMREAIANMIKSFNI